MITKASTMLKFVEKMERPTRPSAISTKLVSHWHTLAHVDPTTVKDVCVVEMVLRTSLLVTPEHETFESITLESVSRKSK